MSFHVGQKVVCVDDAIHFPWKSCPVKRGHVYTVTRVYPEWPSIEVAEVDALGRWGHWAHRFRPIVERKTDISFAHEILKKVTRKQAVRA